MEDKVEIKVTVQFGLDEDDIAELCTWNTLFNDVAQVNNAYNAYWRKELVYQLFQEMPKSVQRLLDLGKKFAD